MSDQRTMPRRFTSTLVLSFVFLAAPAWADYQAGMDAYNLADYATALREWRPLAELGMAPRSSTSACYMPTAKVSPRTMFKRGSGMRRPPSRGTH